jgi:hypothetical protein
MRPVAWFIQAVVLSGLLVISVHAQRVPYQPAGPFTGFDVLLLTESVQQELKLTNDQLRQVKELVRAARLKRKTEFETKGSRSEDRVEKAKTMLQDVSDDTLKGAVQYLKRDQLKRLKQIHVQWLGLQAFFQPELQAPLKLTNEQKQELDRINRQLQQSSSKAVQDGTNKGVEPKLQMIGRLRQQAVASAVALLSSEQKQTWAELTGPAFHPQVPGPNRRPDLEKRDAAASGLEVHGR